MNKSSGLITAERQTQRRPGQGKFKFRVEDNRTQQTNTFRTLLRLTASLQTCWKSIKHAGKQNYIIKPCGCFAVLAGKQVGFPHPPPLTQSPPWWNSLTSSKSCCWFTFYMVSPVGPERFWNFNCFACRSEEDEEEDSPWQQQQVFTLPPATLATGVGGSEGSDLAKVAANGCCYGPNRTVRTSGQEGDAGSQGQRILCPSAAAGLPHDICNKGVPERRAQASS